eukprot:3564238-Pleurochrysis_carterae.AAC.1
MRRHDATAWALGRRSVLAGIARAATLPKVGGGGALAPRPMLLAMGRTIEAMRRGSGAAATRRASDGKWLAQRGKPAAGVAKARRSKADANERSLENVGGVHGGAKFRGVKRTSTGEMRQVAMFLPWCASVLQRIEAGPKINSMSSATSSRSG